MECDTIISATKIVQVVLNWKSVGCAQEVSDILPRVGAGIMFKKTKIGSV